MPGGPRSQKHLEDRARNAGAFAAIFLVILTATGAAGLIPKSVAAVAVGVAVVASIAAWRFYVEAGKAGQEVAEREQERELAELARQAPVFQLGPVVDPTRLGVDRAAQDILPGGGTGVCAA